jgi:hypothetical protein
MVDALLLLDELQSTISESAIPADAGGRVSLMREAGCQGCNLTVAESRVESRDESAWFQRLDDQGGWR